eukprot:1158632-Pelagomonas_calceolata.AAC.8
MFHNDNPIYDSGLAAKQSSSFCSSTSMQGTTCHPRSEGHAEGQENQKTKFGSHIQASQQQMFHPAVAVADEDERGLLRVFETLTHTHLIKELKLRIIGITTSHRHCSI